MASRRVLIMAALAAIAPLGGGCAPPGAEPGLAAQGIPKPASPKSQRQAPGAPPRVLEEPKQKQHSPPESPRVPPSAQSRLTPQELIDYRLVVRARLDKATDQPGKLPEYELGEPVVVELDIRNMSYETGIWVPYSTFQIQGKRYGRAVAPTAWGREIAEGWEHGNRPSGGWLPRFVDDMDHDPRARINGITDKPTRVKLLANLLCDVTLPGEYELEVRFPAKVFRGERPYDGIEATKVVRGENLRLRLVWRQYRLDTPDPAAAKPPAR